MENKIKREFIAVFLVILAFFMIFTLSNNNKVSEVERRELVTFPKISLKSVLKKDYYDKLTSAFNDQLALRNYLVKGYFLFNFQHYFGDAVIGKNKELYSAPQKEVGNSYYNDLKNVTNVINEESKKTKATFIFLSIPRKDAYMVKDLPKNYNSSLDIYTKSKEVVKNNLSSDIIFIDALEVFNNHDIYNCYYSNDHHITPRCAYLLLKEINKRTNTETYDLDNTFKIEKTIVNGAYNRQLGQTVKSKEEELYLVPKINIEYTRYENNKLSNKKVYGSGTSYEDAYMEGDMVYTKIVTKKDGKNIMYVGSSYTNILEALSVPSYKTMVSIDYRHNKTGKSINDYVKENDIDYVVYVPAQSTNSFSINQMLTHLGK